jgi:KilA-N domain
MAKDSGDKRAINHWLANRNTLDYLQELSTDTGIPVSELIQVVKGGNSQQGTWAAGEVAHHFGMWLSPKYAVFVTRITEKPGEV